MMMMMMMMVMVMGFDWWMVEEEKETFMRQILGMLVLVDDVFWVFEMVKSIIREQLLIHKLQVVRTRLCRVQDVNLDTEVTIGLGISGSQFHPFPHNCTPSPSLIGPENIIASHLRPCLDRDPPTGDEDFFLLTWISNLLCEPTNHRATNCFADSRKSPHLNLHGHKGVFISPWMLNLGPPSTFDF
ncbi:hypothetical protein Ccrd_021192 [Cynara cardunculus var. scolymus]|uniref:Uncharacterized protein n=1 Tax=Cynara cardunculus var. scolymus TaxID=59895 RepID=A0A118K0E3_CYNCS|nr:hypothetical protein Ccrd_021192 [Cynara cardunculus var. scolymus]